MKTINRSAHYFPSNLALANLGKPSKTIKPQAIEGKETVEAFLARKRNESVSDTK